MTLPSRATLQFDPPRGEKVMTRIVASIAICGPAQRQAHVLYIGQYQAAVKGLFAPPAAPEETKTP